MGRQADGSLIYDILVDYKFYSKNVSLNDIPDNYDYVIDEDNLDFKIVLTNLSDEVFPPSRIRNIYTRSDSSIDNDSNSPPGDLGYIKQIAPNESFEFPSLVRQIGTGRIKIGIALESSDPKCHFWLIIEENGEKIPNTPYAGMTMPDGNLSSIAQAEKKVRIISDSELKEIQDKEIEKMRSISIRNIQFGISVLILIFSAVNVWHSFWG